MCGIYLYNNKINQHKYVGQSIDVKKRFREHKNAAINPNHSDFFLPIHAAIRKYGLENFDFTIIEECPAEMLNEREIYWIEYYQSYKNGNYNISKGGNTSEHLGKPVEAYDMEGNFVKEYPNAAIAARENNIFQGTLYQVLHQKRSSCAGFQWKYKEDSRIIKPYKTRQGGKLPICQYDPNTFTLIKIWESTAEASRNLHIDASSITKVLKKKLKTCGGYYWEYKKCDTRD